MTMKFILGAAEALMKVRQKKDHEVSRDAQKPAKPNPIPFNLDARSKKQSMVELNPYKLWSYYHGYQGTPGFHEELVYVDTIFFKTGNHNGIKREAIDFSKLNVQIEPVPYTVPQGLRNHGKTILSYLELAGKIRVLKDTGEYENNTTTRVCGIDKNTMEIVIQKARYFDQIATNMAADISSPYIGTSGGSVRSVFEPPTSNGKLISLVASQLSNTLGVAAIMYTNDFKPIFRVRKAEDTATITDEKLHCSVSGVFEIPPEIYRNSTCDPSVFYDGMRKEIKSELNLDTSDYELFPVAFSRELPRAGKPQLFFVALANLTMREIQEKSRTAEESWEFSGEQFHNDPDATLKSEYFTYEGWAARRFANDYLSANKEYFS